MASKWNAGSSSERNSPELKGTEGHMKSGVGLCASIPQGEDLLTTLWSCRMSTVNILLILGMWERVQPFNSGLHRICWEGSAGGCGQQLDMVGAQYSSISLVRFP